MRESDRLYVLFAHNDEPIPDEFLEHAKPLDKPLELLSHRQIQKWKSRRMAYFLLHQFFKENNLDETLLKNILKTDSGRPYILSEYIDFNISHSGDWVAVIISISPQKIIVGIDIEQPKPRQYQKLLAYYASPQEIDEINDTRILPEITSYQDRFYLSWCLREAILKSQGVGIVKLSEVKYSLSQKYILSQHCPIGKLYFYTEFPFYLAYFFSTEEKSFQPTLFELKSGKLTEHKDLSPIIYQVN